MSKISLYAKLRSCPHCGNRSMAQIENVQLSPALQSPARCLICLAVIDPHHLEGERESPEILLKAVRRILLTPEGHDILTHAREVMRR